MTSRLAKVLFTYRITPHSTTGISPAELLLGRQPRTRLDLLRPNTAARVEGRQLAQKEHDSKSRSRLFEKGDHVMVKNQSAGPKWLPGVIVERSGPVSFHVQLEDGGVDVAIRTICSVGQWTFVRMMRMKFPLMRTQHRL